MRAPYLLVAMALVLLTGRALASEEHAWTIAPRTAYVYLGPAERPTGGMMVSADVLHSWSLTESTSLAAGVELGAFGFDTGGRWTAILGGPTAVVRTTLLRSPTLGAFGIGAGLHLDAGRLPTCSRAGLCLLYSGFFPAASLRASYSPSERVTFDIGGAARAVNTLTWRGIGGEAMFAGIMRF